MKVLLLGAGGAASNGFARALRLAGGYELVGTNANADDLWLSECEENHVIPHVSDYDEWRVALAHLVAKEKPNFVHAQNDAEVEALGKIRTVVHMYGAKTYLPSSKTIALCRDKWESYLRWKQCGVPVPDTFLARTHGGLVDLNEPVWMRPRTGAGGQKSFVASSYTEAVWWLDKHDGWDNFTVAEMLTPETVTVQQLYWKGDLIVSQQRTRRSWANAAGTGTGVSGSTGIGETTSYHRADTVANLAVWAVDTKPHGLYGVDMAYRSDSDTPCVTEINIGRFFTTASEFFAMAGFNMADLYVKHGENAYAMNDMGFKVPTPKAVRNPIEDGRRWVRGMDRLPVLV